MNNPIIAIEDHFFDNYPAVLNAFHHATYQDFTLSIDGVTYPYISPDIPGPFKYELLYKLERLLGARIRHNYLFARAMPEGCSKPAKIHSDRDMGAFTAHVYLSPESAQASTSFMKHVGLGTVAGPDLDGSEWSQDPGEWQKYLTCWGAPNRLLVHHAAHFHCAEPSEGFGTLKNDARLMLTCFFDVI
jgi:hypothetical protein